MKRVYVTCCLVIILNLLLFNTSALANDTALSAIGDNVGPFEGTPDVVLDKEEINLNVFNNKTIVSIVFYLRNVGSKQTILVGFPDEFASTRIKGQEEYEFQAFVGPINDFKAWVNNVMVKVDTKYQLKTQNESGYPPNYKTLWHVWPVTFEPNKTTVIKNTYWVENGSDVMGQKNFAYTLITGAKWKGVIGNAKIYANFNNLSVSDINKDNTTEKMTVINPKKAMWELKNFEPNSEDGSGYFRLTFKKNMIPEIKTRNLTEADLKGLSDWELKVLRNEIYARHGRAFKSESLSGFFGSTNWYKINPKYSDSSLNNFEKRNAQFILNYEKKTGSKIIYTD